MKHKPKAKVVTELAAHFEADMDKSMPVTVRGDGSIVYRDYYIKAQKTGNWGLYSIKERACVNEYFLKTCALMAAKAYNHTNMERYQEIKRIDSAYWANHCDTAVYRKNIKSAKDFERYLILLNKLEHSESQTEHYKEEISRMFKWSFV